MESDCDNNIVVPSYPAEPLPQEELIVHARAMRHMKTVEDFEDYCETHDLDMYEQKRLIDQYGGHVCSLDFCSDLDGYAQRIETILKNRAERLTTRNLPETDVAQRSAASPPDNASDRAPQQTILTFALTDEGRAKGFNAWDDMVRGMERLGHLAPESHAQYLELLGVNRDFRRHVALTEKLPFYSGINTLTFWIAMLMNKMPYEYYHKKNGSTSEGEHTVYRCPQLITAPSGQYCLVLQSSVYLFKHAKQWHIEDRRSLITAKKRSLKSDTALPIVAAMRSVGCHEERTGAAGARGQSMEQPGPKSSLQ